MGRFRQEAQAMVNRGKPAHFVLVEVPPYGNVIEGMEPCLHARLSTAKNWAVELPTKLKLQNGVIKEVQSRMTQLGRLLDN